MVLSISSDPSHLILCISLLGGLSNIGIGLLGMEYALGQLSLHRMGFLLTTLAFLSTLLKRL